MGLDQYLFTSSEDCGHLTEGIVDRKELHYWRKHADLNAFMLMILHTYASIIYLAHDNRDIKKKVKPELPKDKAAIVEDLWDEYQDEEIKGLAKGILVDNSRMNNKYMKINIPLLDLLEKVVIDQKLPKGEGFFWGESEYSDEDIAYDLEGIKVARKALEEGKYVYYYPNW